MAGRLLLFSLLFLFLTLACVEPYEFDVENEQPNLVVEGYISDISYEESKEFPSDGRYFTIFLHYAGDVGNRRDLSATNATVYLESDSGEKWTYMEKEAEPGKYVLFLNGFEAEEGKAYKLHIELPNEERYESDWQSLPTSTLATIGNVGFEEVEKQLYKVQAGKQVVETIKGINVFVDLPENNTGSTTFYRWKFTPTWIYIAPLVSPNGPNYKCWVTSRYYLADYALQKDRRGGYRKNLFFIETIRNDRLFERFSLLITQQAMSEDFFYFWKEMKEKAEGNSLFDTPPYNLQTNIHAKSGKGKVSGYFGVVEERAIRWYFSIEDLSYWVDNPLKADCLVVYKPGDPPSPPCLSCEEYIFGEASTVMPGWWKEDK